ncbi:MAG: tetratricopeptide repeat protein [Bacteroidia bacterium]|nr:tetratricopeptide repeat protein [Bacteroidia bacterium]NNM16220.1 tetratricopeptide repeat protein [Bacteroidia bacterium]
MFEKVQEIDPKDDDVRLELALCYIENPTNPMRGISLLRQLIDENPKNENALFNLGILSMRSGQFDKAIGRFEEILAFSPERIELFRYIAHCYEQIGEKDKAIVYFSRFKSKTSDQRLRDETDRYIEKLKEE